MSKSAGYAVNEIYAAATDRIRAAVRVGPGGRPARLAGKLGEDAEPVTRGEYVDRMRRGPGRR